MFKRGLSIVCTMVMGAGVLFGGLAGEAEAGSAATRLSTSGVTNGRIVYTKSWMVDGEQGTDIFSVRPDGTGGRRLTRSRTAENPKWSPNGGRIAFEQDGAVWVMRSDGSGQQMLTSAALVGWMPTGGRVLVVRWADEPGVDPTFLLHTISTGEEEELPIDLPLVAGPLEPPYDDYRC